MKPKEKENEGRLVPGQGSRSRHVRPLSWFRITLFALDSNVNVCPPPFIRLG